MINESSEKDFDSILCVDCLNTSTSNDGALEEMAR